ncbi:MAG: LysR family transcriptional regulator [Gammaproteobacteria bacterium]|nr:LysR family transcriptional regulator [Gammaproteobacteria bacterium]NVK86758.1 LysR family transcriptional regulator [Gammaproteobacteria bacterium]
MKSRLPSLHLLKLFEAAARHESFKAAAAELHLSPSAISHQIRALEEHLGFDLFTRLNRKITLTSAGQAYFDVVSDIFLRLNKGSHNVIRRFQGRRLKVSLMPSLARHQLIPQLSQLRQQLPGVELIIDTRSELVDFTQSDVDIAIRFGRGHWDNVIAEPLTEFHTTLVCSHPFLKQHPMQHIHELASVPLINFSFMSDAWLKVAHAAKLPDLSTEQGLTFGSYDMAILAAEHHQGVALGLLELERESLAQGRLLQPFDIRFKIPQSLYLVYRPGDQAREEIQVFCAWAKQQYQSVE